jgi:hypothetical protein
VVRKLSGNRIQVLWMPREGNDVGPFRQVVLGDRVPDATTGTGDDRDFVQEFRCHERCSSPAALWPEMLQEYSSLPAGALIVTDPVSPAVTVTWISSASMAS